MNPRVVKVETKNNYQILLEFTNGEKKVYDLNYLLDFGVFKELKDINYFNKVKVEFGSIAWPHEQDICPDTLYLDSQPVL
jgi:hypothetical protein